MDLDFLGSLGAGGKFSGLSWSWWYARNKWIFEKAIVDIPRIISKAVNTVNECTRNPNSENHNTGDNEERVGWTAPPEG